MNLHCIGHLVRKKYLKNNKTENIKGGKQVNSRKKVGWYSIALVTWSLGQLSDRTERSSQGFAMYRWKPQFPTILVGSFFHCGTTGLSLNMLNLKRRKWFIVQHQQPSISLISKKENMVYRATSTISDLGSKLSVASAFRGNLRDASSLLCNFTTLHRCIFAIFASLNFYNVAYLLRLQNLFCPKQPKGRS